MEERERIFFEFSLPHYLSQYIEAVRPVCLWNSPGWRMSPERLLGFVRLTGAVVLAICQDIE